LLARFFILTPAHRHFSDIGRKCFAWALRQAWVEAREAARIAALSPAAKPIASRRSKP